MTEVSINTIFAGCWLMLLTRNQTCGFLLETRKPQLFSTGEWIYVLVFFSNKDRRRWPLSKRWCHVITWSLWNSRQTTLSLIRDTIWLNIFTLSLNWNKYQRLFNLSHECSLCHYMPLLQIAISHVCLVWRMHIHTNVHETSVQAHN